MLITFLGWLLIKSVAYPTIRIISFTVALEFPYNHFGISEKCKTVQPFEIPFLQIVPLCKYTLLPLTVKVLETFLEVTLWKSFQLFRRILNDVRSITNVPFLECWFQSREQVNISWRRARRIWRCFNVVTLFFAKKFLTKTDRCAGALSKWRNQLLVLHFSGRFLLTSSLRWRRTSMCISLFTVLQKSPS